MVQRSVINSRYALKSNYVYAAQIAFMRAKYYKKNNTKLSGQIVNNTI